MDNDGSLKKNDDSVNEPNSIGAVDVELGSIPVESSPVNLVYAETKSVSRVYSILGFVLAFVSPLAGLPLSIIGIVESIKTGDKTGKGLSIAGVVVSSILILLVIVTIILSITTATSLVTPVYPGRVNCLPSALMVD